MIKLTTLPQGEVYVDTIPKDARNISLARYEVKGEVDYVLEWHDWQRTIDLVGEFELLGVIGEEISEEPNLPDWGILQLANGMTFTSRAAYWKDKIEWAGIDLKENKGVLILKKI